MPRGINIQNELDIGDFRKEITSRLPFSLKINKNYNRFSEYIFEKTNMIISVSTLKRFFLYDNDVLPSRNTLDILCQTIGKKDWDDYLNSSKKLTDFEHIEMIKSIEIIGYQNKSDFKKIYEKFDYPEYKYGVTLALTKIAIQKKDIDILKDIFMLPIFHHPDPKNIRQYYFLEYFGCLFRNNDIIYDLIPYWAKDPVGQTSYCEFFIDFDNLNGYFGKVMEEYHKYKQNPDGLLLYHCMMYERDLKNGKIESENLQFLIDFKDTDRVKSTNNIRRLALLLVYNYKKGYPLDIYMDEIPRLLSEKDDYLRTLNVYTFCFLVFDKDNFYPVKEVLSNFEYPKKNYCNNIFTIRLLNMIKLYEAFVNLKEWNIEKAEEIFLSIDKMYFLLYSINHYNKQYKLVEKMLQYEKQNTLI
ncbi:MAG: hypothetical protein H6Q19_1242 [Bacteroidetes bacterium]|nr:hypothetical protein [Bacteroidota bacterium]